MHLMILFMPLGFLLLKHYMAVLFCAEICKCMVINVRLVAWNWSQ